MLIIPWLFRISPGVSGKAEDCHKVGFWIIVSGVLPGQSRFLKCFHLGTHA